MTKAAIFLADGFEEVEALTQVDLLRRAGINVFMVTISNDKVVRGAHGMCVETDIEFNGPFLDRMDAIILPGGMPGTSNLAEHKGLKKLIRDFNDERKPICAICAAPMVLGQMGILEGKKACCYPGFEQYLTGAEVQDSKVCHDGNIITSRGVGTAIEFALEIIRTLDSVEKAQKISDEIIY